MIHKIVPTHPSPLSDGMMLLDWQRKKRNIVIAGEFVPEGTAFVVNVFLHLSHSKSDSSEILKFLGM